MFRQEVHDGGRWNCPRPGSTTATLGVRAPRALLRGRFRRHGGVRHRQGGPSRTPRVEAAGAHSRRRLRHAGGGLARQARQHAAPMVGPVARPDPARRLQRRRPHRRAAREQQGRCAVARPLSRRFQPGGQELRLRQEYFFTTASLQDILQRHLSEFSTLASLPEKAAIHLNDTHPAIAVAELMLS